MKTKKLGLQSTLIDNGLEILTILSHHGRPPPFEYVGDLYSTASLEMILHDLSPRIIHMVVQVEFLNSKPSMCSQNTYAITR